jgi:hypothetical protein
MRWQRLIGERNGRLGFPIWLPLLLGVLLFLAGHLLAGDRHHAKKHHVTSPASHLISV